MCGKEKNVENMIFEKEEVHKFPWVNCVDGSQIWSDFVLVLEEEVRKKTLIWGRIRESF